LKTDIRNVKHGPKIVKDECHGKTIIVLTWPNRTIYISKKCQDRIFFILYQ
jgi:hypothetical protein